MEKAVIDAKAESLLQRLNGVKRWIVANPNTEPNFYELIELNIELSELVTSMTGYYEEVGFPKLENGKEATHYDVVNMVPVLCECRNVLSDIELMRHVDVMSLRDEQTPNFAREPEIMDLITRKLHYEGLIGYYQMENVEQLANLQKSILCRCVGISYYIWQVKRYEPGYQYDNKEEFEQLKKDFDEYASLTKMTGMATTMGTLIDKIEKDYKYSDQYQSEAQK